MREITSPKKKHHAKVKRENVGVAGDDFTPVRFLESPVELLLDRSVRVERLAQE